ncbi:MAG: hypothetical protein IEMM0008_0060 [bacterium]|nr:MAG: hypothetical protein IEMM0008_0060 [bacterium]
MKPSLTLNKRVKYGLTLNQGKKALILDDRERYMASANRMIIIIMLISVTQITYSQTSDPWDGSNHSDKSSKESDRSKQPAKSTKKKPVEIFSPQEVYQPVKDKSFKGKLKRLKRDKDANSSIFLSGRYLMIPNRLEAYFAGFYFDWYWTPWISAYYSFYVGASTNGQVYVHMPLGFYLLGELFASGAKLDDDNIFVLLLVLLPEGFNLHIKPFDWLDITPFIGATGIDLGTASNGKKDVLIGGEIGLRLHISHKSDAINFNFGPYASLFTDFISGDKAANGYTLGFNFGLKF